MRHKLILPLASSLLLSGCMISGQNFALPVLPESWTAHQADAVENVENTETLKEWWKRFNDPALDSLVEAAMAGSPDRQIAEARVLEARGMSRSAFADLLPQIDGTANAGREKSSMLGTGNSYDAGFDASFEIDIFGRNRGKYSAAESQIARYEAEYQNVTLSLVGEIARAYTEYRAAEKQVKIAQKNLEAQQKTLDLIHNKKDLGEAPQLDVERAANLVNTTQSQIPEYQRQADNARLRLTVLTGVLPEKITPVLAADAPIPGADVAPVITAPANVIAMRPDVRAAASNLDAQTALSSSAVAELFPAFNLGGFFGLDKNIGAKPMSIWSVTLGTAVTLLDFGRIEGHIDAARAREVQAYETLRKTVLTAVTDVETALTDYARINERRSSLRQALDNAEKSLTLSQQLYKEGEISFLDVLDAQRTVNDADSAVVSAESAQAQALIALYKSLGVI